MVDNVIITRKKVKNFNLKVNPNMDVLLSVPMDATDKQIELFLDSKKMWIDKQKLYFKEHQPKVRIREYVSGESYLYLGKQYRLKVIESDIYKCKLFRGYIYMYVKDKNDIVKKEKIIKSFYKEKSILKLSEILADTLKLFGEKDNIDLQIRKMKSMWGSCSKEKRKILLNSKLIEHRKPFIEYVIAHEVAHLKYSNHSKNFYSWLNVHMPDWNERKDYYN